MTCVEGADEAVVLLAAATTFVLDYDAGYKGGDLSVAVERIQAAAAKTYDALRSAHVADYRRYFDRVRFDLGGVAASAARPTDERLRSYKDDKDAAFVPLFYQYGRYLLISSSRPDNPLPSNTQGILIPTSRPSASALTASPLRSRSVRTKTPSPAPMRPMMRTWLYPRGRFLRVMFTGLPAGRSVALADVQVARRLRSAVTVSRLRPAVRPISATPCRS